MEDAEQVSSTTPEQVAAEERQPGHVSPAAGLQQANAYGHAGSDGEQQSSEAVTATGGAFTEQGEEEEEDQQTRLEDEMELHVENKADTERQEKSNWFSQPDSTSEFALQEEQSLGDFTHNPGSAEPTEEQFLHQKAVSQVQEHMVSSHTGPEEDFGQEKVGTKEEELFGGDFLSDVTQTQMISTTHVTQKEIFNTFDLKQDPSAEPEAAVSSVFSEPVRSVPGLKEEPKWGTDVEPVAEEPFRPAPAAEAHSAPPASSAYEPSLLPSATAVVFPTVMQFSSVVELLYWRDVKNSGIVFGACLLLLLSLSVCSIISVLSYVALALLSVSISFRIYKGVLQAIQKSDEGHPFKLYLEQEVALPEDLVHKYSESVLGRINTAIVELRRLFLVEDLVDSLKFAVLMWILTYVGALFNGLTLLILGLVGAFTFPVIYEKHQVQIDHYIALVTTQVKDIVGKVQAKIPGAKKKSE